MNFSFKQTYLNLFHLKFIFIKEGKRFLVNRIFKIIAEKCLKYLIKPHLL